MRYTSPVPQPPQPPQPPQEHEHSRSLTAVGRQVCELWCFLCVAISWLIPAGSPRELLGDDESGGCARCFGMSSRPSAWLWQLHSTTVLVRWRNRWSCSSTPPYGDRTPAREEVVHDAHDALRGQKTPPPGVRPGSPSDPGPQRSDRTVRRSSGGSSSPRCAGARWWRRR